MALVWGGAGALAATAAGQGAPAADAVDASLEALRRGAVTEAEDLLQTALRADPTSRGGEPARSAGYWLGAAREAAGDSAGARALWLEAVERGAEAGDLDVPAADAYVLRTFAAGDVQAYATAADVYALLLRAGGGLPDDDRETVARHVARALLLVPEAERDSLARGGGRALAGWWEGEDPFPVSALNERVVEHLFRVARALSRYGGRGPTGLDARGDLYVRLGPPARRRAVDFYDPDLIRRINELRRSIANDLLVEPSEFAENEVWVYEGLGGDRDAYTFLFVNDGGGFRPGQTIDLIPTRLRTGLDRNTGRGGAKADVVLEALRTIYRQLSTESTAFGQRYGDVAGYLAEMEALRIRSSARARGRRFGQAGGNIENRADYSAAVQGSNETGVGPPPDLLARSALDHARREDEVLRAQREAAAPAGRATLYRPPRPLFARTARFLGPLGQTQVLAYWPEPEDRAAERGRVVVMSPARRVVADGRLGAGPRRLGWEGGSDGHPLAVQVERAGETYVARLGPAAPLLYGAAVEMSDVVPFLADDVMDVGASLREGLGRGRVSPYAGPSLEGLPGIGLYAEAYLPVGGTDVLVTYTVETRRAGGLFRRPAQTESEQQFFRQSESRVLPVAFLVDRAAWDGADEVRLTVRVEDLETGEAVERSVRFETE